MNAEQAAARNSERIDALERNAGAAASEISARVIGLERIHDALKTLVSELHAATSETIGTLVEGVINVNALAGDLRSDLEDLERRHDDLEKKVDATATNAETLFERLQSRIEELEAAAE